MTLDGRMLSRARNRLKLIREHNDRVLEKRTSEVYSALPEVKRLDGEIKALVIDAVREALKKSADVEAAIDEIRLQSLELQESRRAILLSHGYKEDYLDEIISCPLCRDSGYVLGKACTCLMELYGEEVSRDLSSILKLGDESFDTFSLLYYDSKPDIETGVSPRECMEMVYETCLSFARRFGETSPNLLFQGNTGLGKTFLSACIADVVSKNGFSVVYDTAMGIFEAFEIQKFSRDQEDSTKAESDVRRILKCDLLIMDDLGTEMATAFSQSALYSLINTRLTSGKKTIISTNLSYGELRSRYTPQTVSRLEGEYLNLSFVGKDIRAIKKERGLS